MVRAVTGNGARGFRSGENMGEAMVLVRTFRSETEALAAQEELHASGIQSLLVGDGAGGDGVPGEVYLAVHERDQTIAEAVLKAVMDAE